MNSKGRLTLYPLLFAANPILVLWADNAGKVAFADVARALTVTAVLTLVLIWLFRLAMKNPAKAAIAASVVLIAFFSFGPVFEMVTKKTIAGFAFGRIRYLYPMWILLMIAAIWALAKTRRDVSQIARFLTMMGVVLVALSVVRIGVHAAGSYSHAKRDGWNAAIASECANARGLRGNIKKPLPDIYYIILDCYLRQDVLKSRYHFDNSRFINSLTKKGFYVADKSRSNYPCTNMSLSSSLNYDYLDSVQRAVGTKLTYDAQAHVIADNKIARVLKELGYKYVFFPTGYDISTLSPAADYYMSQSLLSTTQFDYILLQTSMLRVLPISAKQHRDKLLGILHMLGDVPKIKDPTFTFAHVICPHGPYVFDKNGGLPAESKLDPSAIADAHEYRLYLDQMTYLNKLVEKTVDKILARSSTPPIIIIQADHGDGFDMSFQDGKAVPDPKETRERYITDWTSIFNAYYFPRGKSKALYPTITPVNSFRVMLNEYFGARYRLLPDESYIRTDLVRSAARDLEQVSKIGPDE